MELFEAIKNRRSVRRFTSDTVDDEKIEAILEAGHWAPSWGNTQCWRFVVVRDPAVRVGLTGTLMPIKLPDKEIPNPATAGFTQAPVIIVVCAATGRAGFGHGGDREPVTDKGDWFMFDTALAVQNMVLAAHALGLGAVIIGAFDATKVEKVLAIPAGYRAVAMFPVGVPVQPGKAPPRKELSELVFRDKWIK
jgi:nitroreductase